MKPKQRVLRPGRTSWGQYKLSIAERALIRRWYGREAASNGGKAPPGFLREVAEAYGIHPTTVSAIGRGTGSYRSMHV